MTDPAKASARRVWRFAMALAAVAAAGRLVQLAGRWGASRAPTVASVGLNATDAGGDRNAALDAELSRLYASCPMAAVVDFQTVAASPEKSQALLPPYRPTVERVADPSADAGARSGQWLCRPE